jgi:hypothetical protein
MALAGASTSIGGKGQPFMPAVNLAMSLVEGSVLNLEKSTLLFSKGLGRGTLPRALADGFFIRTTPMIESGAVHKKKCLLWAKRDIR